MSFSYSKVTTHDQCGYKYKLRYIYKLNTLPFTDPECPFYCGTAVHTGIETRSIEKAIENYKANYTDFTIDHEVTIAKLKAILEKAIKQIPEGEYEHKLAADDGFIGFIDELVQIEDGVFDLYDFKYSGNISGYSQSGQIHLYKYYFEKLTGNKIRDMYYVFIPKCTTKLNESKSNLDTVSKKIAEHAAQNDVMFVKIEYNPQQVGWFFGKKYHMEHDTEFAKRYTTKCQWCDYAKFCLTKGEDTSELDEESKLKWESIKNEQQGTV